ncbi:hypothetical protein HPB50_010582 [Hyalomma asiaticum]|uniref:Uncharacterized protein n=1 Tax=Hyalomma asiaticum TaxID=266040 RepID=A0ACB7SXS4_HYAAI|nr:hypothetical protein HPB50_010582 [Hyalomma asiaticum]
MTWAAVEHGSRNRKRYTLDTVASEREPNHNEPGIINECRPVESARYNEYIRHESPGSHFVTRLKPSSFSLLIVRQFSREVILKSFRESFGK